MPASMDRVKRLEPNLGEEKNPETPWWQAHYMYHPDYGEMLIDHMSRGHSLESFGYAAKVSITVINRWRKENPHFQEAYRMGEQARLYNLEEKIQGQIEGTIDGKAATLIFALKNQFPNHYQDKQQVETTVAAQIVVDTGISRGQNSLPDVETSGKELDMKINRLGDHSPERRRLLKPTGDIIGIELEKSDEELL
jgi:hypothetical protein